MRNIFLILIILVILLSSCREQRYSFLDVESGKLKLDEKEKIALKNLLEENNISKKDISVGIKDETARRHPIILIKNNHVVSLSFSCIKIYNMKFVKELKLIEEINITNGNLQKIEGVDSLKRLEDLNLGNNRISHKVIINNSNIKWLSLGYNTIDSLIIENCNNLDYIYCKNNNLKYFYLKNLPSIDRVVLSQNNITNFNINDVNIDYLDISENKMTNLPSNFNKNNVTELKFKIEKKKEKIQEKSQKEKSDGEYFQDLIDSTEKARGVYYITKTIYGSSSVGASNKRSNINKGMSAEMSYLSGLTKQKFRSNYNSNVRIDISVEKGKVRVYLKGNKEKGMLKCLEIDDSKPSFIVGPAFSGVGMHNFYFYVESLKGSAKGIKYTITY